MIEHRTNMLKAESAYLAGVEANLETAKGRQLDGSRWVTSRHDDSDRLRALMAGHRVYDREKLKQFPQNRRIAVHGYRRTWWFGKRRTGVAVASVLCPLESLVADGDGSPPPIDLAELQDHVRRLVVDPTVDHVVSVCAPSGFTASARLAKSELPNVALVLVEPKSGGGWKVSSTVEGLPANVLALFDPERDADKIERVRGEIRNRSADLLTGGVSASSIARRLDLPKEVVVSAIRKAVAEEPGLQVSRKSDDVLLFRGAAVSRPTESLAMNVVERIRQLFSREGDEAAKINVLAERRAKLAQQRDQLYEDIGKLEAKESELLLAGRENKSLVARRRLAAQLAQLRKDIGRQNTTANMLNQQINIISTDIHNLTLIQQGNVAQLPSTEELTENAVKAEEMLESLAVDAELVSGLETGMSALSTSEEELAILKEFDETPEPAKPAPVEARKSARKEASIAPPPPIVDEPSKRPQRRSGGDRSELDAKGWCRSIGSTGGTVLRSKAVLCGRAAKTTALLRKTVPPGHDRYRKE